MALVDKIARDGSSEIRIAAHTFSAGVYFWAKGDITRQQLIDGLGLEASDEVQLDQLSTFYASLSVADKQEFHQRVEAASILLQEGQVTKTKFKSLLGMV